MPDICPRIGTGGRGARAGRRSGADRRRQRSGSARVSRFDPGEEACGVLVAPGQLMAASADTFLRATITKRTELSDDLWVIRVNASGDTDQWSLDARNTTAYLCGHPEMIEHGKAILHRHGWEKDAMKEERYFVPAPIHA